MWNRLSRISRGNSIPNVILNTNDSMFNLKRCKSFLFQFNAHLLDAVEIYRAGKIYPIIQIMKVQRGICIGNSHFFFMLNV